MAKPDYDVVVIGAGSGGLGVAIGMAKFGFNVLLIDKKAEHFGGECLNTGCVPSKALIHVAEIMHNAKKSAQYGFTVSGKPDVEKVFAYVNKKQATIRAHETPRYLEENEGVQTLLGEAKFVGKRSISVNGKTITAKKILVATGSAPRVIPFNGMEMLKVYTNENLFDLNEFPKNLVIIGAGPIGLEMAQAFSRLGVHVSVVEKAERIMRNELPQAAALLQERLELEGINFYLNASVLRAESSTEIIVEQNKKEKSLPCDAVLFGVGRTLNFKPLHLQAANIKCNENDLPILDDYLRSKTNKNVLFAGDAAHNLMFSHAAELHTSIILTNFFAPHPFKKKWNTNNFSWVTFTKPEVATFGLSETEIKKRNIPYELIDFPFTGDDRATVSDYQYGRLFLFLKKNKLNPRNGKILGGTIVAPEAGEMIQELITAREKGLGAGVLFNKIYPYPTQSRVHKIALVEKFGGEIAGWIKKGMKVLFH